MKSLVRSLAPSLALTFAVAGPLRAQSPYPAAQAAATQPTIAQLQYGGGGDWYANPSALPNLIRVIRERTGVPVADQPVHVRPTDPFLWNYPYLYITGHGNIRFTDEDVRVLRQYLTEGGFLHVDDNYGLDESFRREIGRIFPEKELVEIPADHPVYHVFYDFPDGLPKIHEHDGEPARGFGIFHEGRLVVFYSYESDLGDGWEDADVHNDPAHLREAALRMGVNLFIYAMGQVAP